jgi:hypothetical protein
MVAEDILEQEQSERAAQKPGQISAEKLACLRGEAGRLAVY